MFFLLTLLYIWIFYFSRITFFWDKPSVLQERIELQEFSLGSCPPVLGLNGIRWSTSGDQVWFLVSVSRCLFFFYFPFSGRGRGYREELFPHKYWSGLCSKKVYVYWTHWHQINEKTKEHWYMFIKIIIIYNMAIQNLLFNSNNLFCVYLWCCCSSQEVVVVIWEHNRPMQQGYLDS